MSENKPILNLSISHCIEELELAVTSTIIEVNRTDSKGGYAALYDFVTPAPLFIVKLGSFRDAEPERQELCFAYCQEKGMRLQQNRSHVSSFQSRNDDAKCYGGAVRGNDVILSFSGLPEVHDELAMVRAGIALGFFPDYYHVREIAAASENKLVFDLFRHLVGQLP